MRPARLSGVWFAILLLAHPERGTVLHAIALRVHDRGDVERAISNLSWNRVHGAGAEVSFNTSGTFVAFTHWPIARAGVAVEGSFPARTRRAAVAVIRIRSNRGLGSAPSPQALAHEPAGVADLHRDDGLGLRIKPHSAARSAADGSGLCCEGRIVHRPAD
jgi:hypothetical protein